MPDPNGVRDSLWREGSEPCILLRAMSSQAMIKTPLLPPSLKSAAAENQSISTQAPGTGKCRGAVHGPDSSQEGNSYGAEAMGLKGSAVSLCWNRAEN